MYTEFTDVYCKVRSDSLDCSIRFCMIRSPDNYEIGLTKKILLDISVMNSGEDSYDTRCYIQLPAGVEYVSSNSSSIVS